MYTEIEKENGEIELIYKDESSNFIKNDFSFLCSIILHVERNDSAIIIQEANSQKWNIVRNGRVEWERPAEFLFENRFGEYIFVDLDKEGKVQTGNDMLVAYDTTWGGLKSISTKESGPRIDDYWTSFPDGEMLIDSEGNMVSAKYKEKLQEIYKEPSSFLTLETKNFKDESFVRAATVAVKNSIGQDVASKEEISEEYVALTQDLVTSVKEKTEKEFENVAQMKLEEERRLVDLTQKKENIERFLGDL